MAGRAPRADAPGSCPACGAAASATAKFCGECGHRLEQHAPSASRPAERRQLSVMFCDLVGSTTLSGRLDPEDMRELLREYHDAATRAIRDFDGHVAEYLGDGLVVYFGYPQAHEDDAERACRAGLRIVENMASLNGLVEPRLGMRLGVRIGVHTGLVVVGEVGARDVRDVVRVVGETPNIAARVQGEAPVDGVVVTGETRALAGDGLDMHSMGVRTLKGVAEAVELFEVRSVRDGVTGRTASAVPIVDREEAQVRLRQRWSEVTSGASAGGAIVLSGEAGIGKSKLLDALRDVAEADGGIWFEAACSPYHQASAHHPIATMLRSDASFAANLETTAEDDADLLAPLFGRPARDSSRHLGVAPALVRRATNEAILRLLRSAAGDRPAVLAVEDVHLADASTGELVDLIHADPRPGLLLVTTERPEPDGAARGPTCEVIELGPLGPDDVATLVELTAGAPVSPALRADLAARTDGVPLFATELLRTLVDAGAVRKGDAGLELRPSVDRATIPSRLQDSLMARIDRLGAAKPIAQLAATIGRTFVPDLLAAVADVSVNELQAALGQLVAAKVVQRQADGGFAFTHALLRDVAYESMLRATRREQHRRIATVLVDGSAEPAEAEPALVASHLALAGETAEAHVWWRRAAQQATARSASADALAALRNAAALLPSIPDSPTKAREELATHAALGSALAAVRGYGDDETAAAYQTALDLAAAVPAAPELFPVLFGLVAFYTARGQFAAARSAADQLWSSATAADDDGLRIEAHFSLGVLDVYTGRFDDALEHLRDGIDLYDADRHHQLAFSYVFDPGVACLRTIGIPLTLTGQPEAGRRAADDAIALAQRLDHRFSLASAHVFSGIVASLTGADGRERAAADADVAIEIADAAGYPFWSLSGRVLRGWAVRDEASIAAMRAAVTTYRATGTKVFVPLWLVLQGDAERDKSLLDEAAHAAAETGERGWDAVRAAVTESF